jgi:hypothetical protein
VIEATESLRMGDPADPAVSVGPLIDQAAHERVRGIIEAGRQEATLAFETPVTERAGWFVGPTIFTDVAPDSRLAQEEIFGPVLAVIDAADLAEALRIANSTPYALTGGCYSRSPAESNTSAFGLATSTNRGITVPSWRIRSAVWHVRLEPRRAGRLSPNFVSKSRCRNVIGAAPHRSGQENTRLYCLRHFQLPVPS